MTVGTKSLLFGVHAVWWHPLVVLAAWLRLYRSFPSIHELIAIFCHDFGYWGCNDMDGDCGTYHPVRGATIAMQISRGVNFLLRPLGFKCPKNSDTYLACLLHSSRLAREMGREPSKLCAPDKASMLFEPWWFYSLRARLSGELNEYMANGPAGLTPEQWFRKLQNEFKAKYKRCDRGNHRAGHEAC